MADMIRFVTLKILLRKCKLSKNQNNLGLYITPTHGMSVSVEWLVWTYI